MGDPVYIGRYRVIEELGRGGMGVVYRGEDPVLERPVAIKVLPPKRLTQKMVERFLREAKTAARLDSPYIVKIHDIGQVDDIYFIVMELVDGQALSDMIQDDVIPQPAQLRERLGIFRQVLEAVSYAHENQVIHRDLKPDNIMINKSGRVKVMDFGLAFFQGHHSLTEVGQVMGTAAYVSPEQAQGKVTDCRTDIYSLGVILFEIITGSWPFNATNPLDMFRKVAEMPPPSPSGLNPTISPELEQIVLRMLAKNPDERYQNIKDILAVYDRAVEANIKELPPVPVPTALPAKKIGPGEFDAQALLDSIASSSDISKEWLEHINLEETLLGNKEPEPAKEIVSRPKPPAPGPALRQVIEQTSVDMSGGFRQPGVDQPAPAVSLLNSDSPTSAASGSGSLLESAAAEKNTSAAQSGADADVMPSQAVSPAQYSSSAAAKAPGTATANSSVKKPYVNSVKSGAVASTSWMADVGDESGAGKVENLLGRLQRQEKEVEAINNQVSAEQRSLFCPKCGAENSPNATTCDRCGSTLSITEYITQREAANYLEEGKSLYEKANFKEAIVALLQAIAKDSNSSEAYLYLGRAYLETGEFGEAHNAIERAINLSTDAAPYLALADFYQYTNQPEMVLSSLQHAEDREPYDLDIRCRLAFALREAGRIEAAIQEYREAVTLDPENIEANRQLGMLLADCQQIDEAISCLEQVCYLDPRDRSAYSLLSRLYIQTGRNSQAQQVLRKALQYDSDNAELHAELATLYLAQNQGQQAVEELNASLEIDPGNTEASLSLANLLYQHGQVGDAVQQLEQALTHHPHNAQVHRQLGEVYMMAGHLDKALDHFEALVALDPQSSELYSRLGRIYQKKRYDGESVNAYRKAVELHPVNSAYREDLAMAYYTAGQLEPAAQEFAKAARLDYTNPEYPKALGIIMVDMGHYEEAVRQFRQSLSLNNNDAQAHGMLGKALAGQGLTNVAITEFQYALELAPQWYFLNLPLARAYSQQGKYEQALSCFKAFMKNANSAADNSLLLRAYIDMGFSYLALKDYNRAAEVFRAVLNRNRSDADAWRGMAEISLAKKNYDQAQQCLNQGLQVEPRSLKLQMLAADIQGARGAWANAVSVMQTACEQHPDEPDAFEHLGRALRKSGRMQDAIDVFNDAAQRFPNLAGNFTWLRGRVEFRQGQYDAALWSYRQALEMVCDDWRIYVDLGKACVSLQQMNDAQSAFNQAVRCAPSEEKKKIRNLMSRLNL
ncbi:MAG: tetratricopeptide repeat protein [bacterium]|nr:tetratricopeptide repeat protein [bacterium]